MITFVLTELQYEEFEHKLLIARDEADGDEDWDFTYAAMLIAKQRGRRRKQGGTIVVANADEAAHIACELQNGAGLSVGAEARSLGVKAKQIAAAFGLRAPNGISPVYVSKSARIEA